SSSTNVSTKKSNASSVQPRNPARTALRWFARSCMVEVDAIGWESYMLLPVNPVILKWVEEIKALTTPDAVVYCDGSDAEQARLIAECLATGELIKLNQQKMPVCYLHRSAPHDVAPTEHLTFIRTAHKEDPGS